MILNLSNNMIEQYYMDCTYKCVPPSIYKFKLMVISGIDISANKIVLCLFVLLMNEKKLTFDNIFTILKEKFKFNPKNIMCDFIYRK